jgi:hypothetical protein
MVKSCPTCKAKVDPTFTTHCPECGTGLTEGAQSMAVPAPMPADAAEPHPPAANGGGSRSGVGRGIATGLVVRLTVAAVLLGAGAIYGYLTNARRDDSGAIAGAGKVGATELSVGDCLDWPPDDQVEFESVRAIPCTEEHDAEVVAVVFHPAEAGSAYPGDDSVFGWAEEPCASGFLAYIGLTYEEEPSLGMSAFTPTETGWSQDDRTIFCVVYNLDDSKLKRSVRAPA